MKVQEIIDQRVKLVADARAITEKGEKEKRALTVEERQSLSKINTDIGELRGKLDEAAKGAEEESALRASIDAEERDLRESRGRKTGAPTPTPGDNQRSTRDEKLALRAWALGKHAKPEMLEAAQRCGIRADLPYIDMAVRTSWGPDGKEVRSYVPVPTTAAGDVDVRALDEQEQRALSIGTTTAGGNAVANEMMQKYSEFQKFYGRLADLAEQVGTETGALLPWPTVDDTANTGEVKTEANTVTLTADPSFGVVNLSAFLFSSKGIYVSWELLQDSFVNISQLLGRQLGVRIARLKNTKFTTGAGTTEPKGIITGGTTTAAASSTAFTPDEIIALIHSVDRAYRAMPGTAFMAHDTILSYIRKMKDGTGRYLWEPSLQVGQPDRLLGYPVEPNNDMDSALTTAKKLVLFGCIPAGFVVRSAGAVRFIRDESIRVREHQVFFDASERGDSNVVDANAYRVLTLA